MSAPITTDLVWAEIARRMFTCLAFVSPLGGPRSAGVIYVVSRRRLYVATAVDSWKAKHIRANPHVALTIPIPKRIPFLPWIRIPQATISFHGTARVLSCDETDPALLQRLLQRSVTDPALRASTCVIEIEPAGHFATYGIGVSLREMADHDRARGRVPVGAPA